MLADIHRRAREAFPGWGGERSVPSDDFDDLAFGDRPPTLSQAEFEHLALQAFVAARLKAGDIRPDDALHILTRGTPALIGEELQVIQPGSHAYEHRISEANQRCRRELAAKYPDTVDGFELYFPSDHPLRP